MKSLNYVTCQLCPRACHVNRHLNQKGYCHQTEALVVGRAALHFWEEPCISGERGSGAVFFAGCTMGCVYCQNRKLAKGQCGKVITIERLSEIFLELQAQGAHNINLVTPTHYAPSIKEALLLAKEKGMTLPVVYNCGGYETVDTLKTLEGLIDIYLPDFKYMDETLALRYSKAKQYAEYAKKALEEMVRQVGSPRFGKDGMMQKGVIVRHLMLPGQLIDSKAVIRYLYETYQDQIYLSIMNQYTPLKQIEAYPELNRKITHKAYNRLIDYALSLGVTNAFIQEGETASESFIPDFNGEGV